MEHFGLGAYQQFHISTDRILRFSPYSSTFDSFQLVFPSIFQDPAVFIFLSLSIPAPFHPPAMFMRSFSPLTPSNLALSHYVSLFIPYSRCAPCLYSPPNCSDCYFHALASSVVCSIRLSVSNSSELPVLRPLCLTAKQRPRESTEKNGMMGRRND